MFFPFGETVVILRTEPDDVDPYGDPIPGASTETPVEGCAVWTGREANAEPVAADRAPLIADLTISFPAGTDVRSTDRVRVRGKVYDVEGDPFEFVNPFTGWRPGVVAYANRGQG